MSVRQMAITIRESIPEAQETGHFVAYTDAKLHEHMRGPLGGYEALALAKRLVADPGVSDVVYIARNGQRHGEDEIREARRRR